MDPAPKKDNLSRYYDKLVDLGAGVAAQASSTGVSVTPLSPQRRIYTD
jgi:hypothetical protein